MATTELATNAYPSLDDVDRANVETGVRLTRSLALQNAALDQRLSPACVRVMAAISYFMNDKTMRAWPGYDLLAEVSGYSYDVIDRSIRKLKATGYLRTQRHAPITGGRALVHYGYGKIDPEFLEQLISDAVAKIKERKADSDQKVRVSVNPTKKSGSATVTPTFSSSSDSDILNRQEPIKNRNPRIRRIVGSTLGILIDEVDLEEFNQLYNTWGRKAGCVPLSTSERDQTDLFLDRELGAFAECEPSILQSAFVAALNTTSSKSRELGPDGGRQVQSGTAMMSYFRRVLRSEIDNSRLADAKAQAHAASEQRVLERLLSKRLAGVDKPRSGSGNRRSSLADLMNEVPDDGGFD